MVDGASRFTAFRKIASPLVASGFVATAVFSLFQAARGTDWGGVMAGSTIMALPVIIFFPIVQRRVTSGVTAGAVEG